MMKKLMLDVAELRVQSFIAAALPASRGGTVHGREATPACTDPPVCGTVLRVESCYGSCTEPEFC
ncbi:MAG TPA: hypothetical protein VE871_10035 [Longimicrobium sp.]|nr:hypothetical protein [Longimicrobium sp.]